MYNVYCFNVYNITFIVFVNNVNHANKKCTGIEYNIITGTIVMIM